MNSNKHYVAQGSCIVCGETEEWLQDRAPETIIRTEFAQIVFLDGEEGREITDALYRVEGVTAQGRTRESIRAAIDHLAEWDMPGGMEVTSEIPWGSSDALDFQGDYILSSNLGLGYAALARIVEVQA